MINFRDSQDPLFATAGAQVSSVVFEGGPGKDEFYSPAGVVSIPGFQMGPNIKFIGGLGNDKFFGDSDQEIFFGGSEQQSNV